MSGRSRARDRSRPSGGAPQRDALTASSPFALYDVALASVSGGVIDSITDSIGGRNVTSTTTQRPAYTASDANFNSKPSYTGDLTDDRLITSAGTIADWKFLHDGTGMEIMAVVRRGGAASVRPLVHTAGGTYATVGMMMLVNNAGTVMLSIGNGSAALQATATGAIGAGQTRVVGVRYREASATKASVYANAVELASNSTWAGPSASSPTRALVLNNYYDSGIANESCAAPTAFVAVWNRELTSTERSAIVALLNARYGAV